MSDFGFTHEMLMQEFNVDDELLTLEQLVNDEMVTSPESGFTSDSAATFPSPDRDCLDDGQQLTKPYLRIIEEPEEQYRFRYEKEAPVPHGPILGCNFNPNKISKKKIDTGPKVKLFNFSGEAIIRCRLTLPHTSQPHVHQLVVTGRKVSDETREPHDIKVGEHNDYTASFDKLNIIHAVKANREYMLDFKKRKCLMGKEFNATGERITTVISDELKKEIKKAEKNSASLHFEAFALIGGKYERICEPVVSREIHNIKNAKWNPLKIYRHLPPQGSCEGNDEAIILVDKITYDVIIRFYELNDKDEEIWHADVKPEETHKQVAIVFRTPEYSLKKISEPVLVHFKIIRVSNQAESPARKFIFTPSKNVTIGKKRRVDTIDNFVPEFDDSYLAGTVNNDDPFFSSSISVAQMPQSIASDDFNVEFDGVTETARPCIRRKKLIEVIPTAKPSRRRRGKKKNNKIEEKKKEPSVHQYRLTNDIVLSDEEVPSMQGTPDYEPLLIECGHISQYSPSPNARTVKATEMERVVFQTESARPVFHAQSARPVFHAQSARPVYQAESARPVFHAQSARPVFHAQSAGPVYQAESARPVYQAESARPVFHAQSARPVFHAQSAGPVYQAESARPVHQAQSAWPVFQTEGACAPLLKMPVTLVKRVRPVMQTEMDDHQTEPARLPPLGMPVAQAERPVYQVQSARPVHQAEKQRDINQTESGRVPLLRSPVFHAESAGDQPQCSWCSCPSCNQRKRSQEYASGHTMLLNGEIMNYPDISLIKSSLKKYNKAGETVLLAAIKNNFHDEVVKILKSEPDFIHQKTLTADDGPFHVAVKNRRYEIIRDLIKMNFEWNDVNGSNLTPLHYAVHFEDIELIKLFLPSNKVDIRPKLNVKYKDSSDDNDDFNDSADEAEATGGLKTLKGPPLTKFSSNKDIIDVLRRNSEPLLSQSIQHYIPAFIKSPIRLIRYNVMRKYPSRDEMPEFDRISID